MEAKNETNDGTQSQKMESEEVLCEEVLITDFNGMSTTDLQLETVLSNTCEGGSSKSDKLHELDIQLGSDDVGNEEERGDSADKDPTFRLRDKLGDKRKKPGRPKKRKRKDFKCEICNKVYTAYPSLVYHKLSHHENKRDFECTECGKKFAHKALLANHMFSHSSEKSFICEETNCNFSFKTR